MVLVLAVAGIVDVTPDPKSAAGGGEETPNTPVSVWPSGGDVIPNTPAHDDGRQKRGSGEFKLTTSE